MRKKEMLLHVAREMNMTPQEVEQEMQKAIAEAMRSTDPKVQQRWKQLAPSGKEPTVEEFIEYCAKEVRKKL